MCKCLLSVCFEETSDDSPDDSPYEPPRSNRITRSLFQAVDPPIVEGSAHSAANTEEAAGNDEEDDNCCQNDTSAANASSSTMSENNPHAAGLKQFWRRFTERWGLEDSTSTSGTSANTRNRSETEDSETERMPILTQASTFDSSKEVLTIQTEQVVLPGSELQQQMAKAMASKLEEQDDECVICMEGFDPSNPRMPTLCGCGENKTYFHLPCLYQWIEQSRNCPSCRKKLRWEEF